MIALLYILHFIFYFSTIKLNVYQKLLEKEGALILKEVKSW